MNGLHGGIFLGCKILSRSHSFCFSRGGRFC
uniref:Uncharacterized protein n=1 Tax=Rhizophora mucronata TaxID=61149 RepID=A0A2P2JP43_RHIMU